MWQCVLEIKNTICVVFHLIYVYKYDFSHYTYNLMLPLANQILIYEYFLFKISCNIAFIREFYFR
jgi:hypothetical protein